MQQAFLDHDGYQCGYCTPGQVCSAVGMLDEAKQGHPSHVTEDLSGAVELDDDEIRERMSGNLCRCGAYVGILAAVREAAARRMRALDYVRADDAAGRRRLVGRQPDARASSAAAPTSSTTSSSASPRPALLVDVSRLPLDDDPSDDGADGPGCASAPTSATATWPRTRCVRARAARPSPAPCSPARPGRSATRPPPAATCCSAPGASTSRTSRTPVQQARARQRLLGARGLRPLQRRPRRQRRTASPPTPPTWRSRLAALDAAVVVLGAGRRAPGAARRPAPAARATPPTSTRPWRHGDLITAVELPADRPSPRARPTARCATGRPTPSRWSRSPPALRPRRRARPRRPDRAGAGSPTSRGGPAAPRRRPARRPLTEDAVRAAVDDELDAARTTDENAYKMPMVRNVTTITCCRLAAGGAR